MILIFIRPSILAAALLVTVLGPVRADPPKVDWQQIKANLWFAKDQVWGSIKFSALKVHLGYYKLQLVDIRTFRAENITPLQKLDENRQSLVDAGIGAIFKAWPRKEEMVAVAPAG